MQNRTCLDHRDRLAAKSRRVIDNRRHFVVWVYFAEFGAKVVAFEDVINYREIRNRGLLQHEGSFAQDFPAGLAQTPTESLASTLSILSSSVYASRLPWTLAKAITSYGPTPRAVCPKERGLAVCRV